MKTFDLAATFAGHIAQAYIARNGVINTAEIAQKSFELVEALLTHQKRSEESIDMSVVEFEPEVKVESNPRIRSK